MKVLTCFIDGLKPESIHFMPFLDSLEQSRVITDMGYSITCHATMYSGVYPNKHLRWFLWKYSPESSPFKWTKVFRYFSPDELGVFFHKIATHFNKNRSMYNYLLLWYVPLKYWSFFDIEEKNFWTDSDYLSSYPSVFDILKEKSVPFGISGMEKDSLLHSADVVKNYHIPAKNQWTYLFFGEIDHLSHMYGQDSKEVRMKLCEIDGILESKYKSLQKNGEDFSFMLFSDHGHIPIEKRIDLRALFRKYGDNLKNYICFIDANYARFWIKNQEEKNRILTLLSTLTDKGRILSRKDFEEFHVEMPDNRYGDVIFYLDAPNLFSHEVTLFGKRFHGISVSGHGYVPNDGVFVSDCRMKKNSVSLVDILPSVLQKLDLKIPAYCDGEIVWR